MGWESDLRILHDFYDGWAGVAHNLQVQVTADWLRKCLQEEDSTPSTKIQEAITAHANGTDGTRALSPGSDDESGKGPPQLDTRLADDLNMTPRDSM